MHLISTFTLVALFFTSVSGQTLPSAPARLRPRDCGPGTFFQRGRCKDCPLGTFQISAGATSCTPCPPGTFGTVAGAQGLDVCQLCPDGTFSTREAATSRSTCRPCRKGSNSFEGSSFCTSCPKDTVIDFDNRRRCEFCGNGGFTVARGANECMDCSFIDNGRDNLRFVGRRGTGRCESCPRGTAGEFRRCAPCNGTERAFNDGTFTGCRQCLPGFRGVPVQRAARCAPCPKGTAASADDDPFGPFTACPKCKAGENSNATGALICVPDNTPCPANYFRNKQGGCARCNRSQRYDPRRRTCVPCGKNQESGGSLSTKCTPCKGAAVSGDDGCECPEGSELTLDGGCRLCPPGTTTESLGKKCTPCRAGFFAPKAGLAQCEVCPDGLVQPQRGQAKCIRCRKGLIGISWRSFSPSSLDIDDFSDCVSPKTLCPPGTTRVNDNLGRRVVCNPPVCPPDTFKLIAPPEIPCESFFCNVEEGVYCERCPKTHRYDPVRNTCILCNFNEVSDGGLSTKCRRCPPLEVGFQGKCACMSLTSDGDRFFGTKSRGLLNGRCRFCPPGTYGLDGTAVCTPCPPGTFQDEEGEFACKICRAGSFSDKPGSTTCKQCPRGSISFGSPADTFGFEMLFSSVVARCSSLVDCVGSSSCVRPGSLRG